MSYIAIISKISTDTNDLLVRIKSLCSQHIKLSLRIYLSVSMHPKIHHTGEQFD